MTDNQTLVNLVSILESRDEKRFRRQTSSEKSSSCCTLHFDVFPLVDIHMDSNIK